MNKKTITLKSSILILILLTTLFGCSSTDFNYSSERARFSYDSRTHTHSPALASALNNVGVFCVVSEALVNGKNSYRFTNNQGLSDVVEQNAIDQRQTTMLGQNNGLIVGYGNLDTPAPFYVYDLECPHCFNANVFPIKSYPISVNNTGIGVCNNCKRQFNLNTGGNMVKGEGRYRLTVYRGINNPKEIIVVNN